MSAVVVFIIFAICLIIAIPISISLGIVAVLPGAFDCFIYGKCRVCHPFHGRRNRQFPVTCSADVCACGNPHGTRQDFRKII